LLSQTVFVPCYERKKSNDVRRKFAGYRHVVR
jgi:hypothetical protein